MPTMMNSPFNLEYKITYDELSPSLQDMFKSLQNQISDNRNEINNLNDRCDDIDDRIDGLEDRVDKAEANITYLQSIKQNFEIIGEQNGYPIGINTINMADGKQLLTQYFVVQSYTSGGGNPEYAFTIPYPKPMDRVISIQVEDAHVRSDRHQFSGYIDGEWWIRATSVNGAGFIIQYDSVHEVDENATFLFYCQVTGYVLTGEIPKPPEIEDPGGSDSPGSTTDRVDSLEERVAKLEADIPIGTVRYVYSIPEGWIELNGQLVSRTEYSDLWSWANSNNLVVTEEQWNAGYVNNRSNKGLFSYGDNSTTFRLPDFRSRFIRGLDNGAGYDPDRLLGTEELPTLVPGYDNNDDLDYFKTNNITPDQWFIMHPGQTYTWANIGYLSTRSYENGVPGVIDYPDRDVAGCWSADAFKMTDYQGSKYSTVYSDNKSTRIDLYYTSSIRDRLQLGTYYGVGSKIDETTILPNTWYAASRPRNIALKAIIKYK